MRNLLIYNCFIGIVIILSSCAQEFAAPHSSMCTAEQTDDGVVVRCNGIETKVSNGKDGVDGKDGAQGVKGDTGNTGITGATGAQGQKGDMGSKGDTGSQGIPGVQGIPGSSVTTVKFCDDYVPVYPSSFPEYGICIDNKLYGVYYSSSLGVFLAYLPPGTYRSTNNSQACIFAVTSGCEITP